VEVSRRYAALLVLAVLLSFSPAFFAGITNWDDDHYLDAAARPASWLLTNAFFGNYQPLTMLSLHLDRALFGVNGVELHAVNIALHCAAVIAVFALLLQLTATPFAAFAGALLFAVHPLRVESVAWIAERKDVLCVAFFAAALALYAAWLHGRRIHIGWIYALFIAALLSKATAAVLPAAMMLVELAIRRRITIRDKLPMFALGFLFSLLTIHLQAQPGASLDLPHRLLLEGRALTMYVSRELVPLNLSAFYAYPHAIGAAEWWGTFLALLLCASVLATLRFSLNVFAAAAFFLVTIVPMPPLVNIGRAFIADRYTYIPSIGIAWLAALAVERIRNRAAVIIIAIAIAFILGALTFQRTQVWHDSLTLWTSVLESDGTNAIAWNGRGVALIVQRRFAEAAPQLDRAIALDPCYENALRNRGMLAMMSHDEAAARAIAARLLDCHRIRRQ